VGEVALEQRVDSVYGSLRLIRHDEETVLAWARQDSAVLTLTSTA
jgi:hypothetical protein